VIDECDYYLLIVGARYGSTDEEGVSFTEREFNYARSIGKMVIALLHNDIENLPMKNFDADPSLKIKLDTFRDKVKSGRMVRYWNNRDQLIAAIMQAIVKAINTYPATGWIRGDAAASDEIMQQFMHLRTTYDELATQYNALLSENSAKLEGLASLNDVFLIRFRYTFGHFGHTKQSGELKITWAEILKIVGPDLYSPVAPAVINNNIRIYIYDLNRDRTSISVNQGDADTIKVHLSALGLIKIEAANSKSGGVAEFVSLTEKGRSELLSVMAVRGKGG
jgi:hypothetical protein